METEFIRNLFIKQMKEITLRTAAESFDYQFSDAWNAQTMNKEVTAWN